MTRLTKRKNNHYGDYTINEEAFSLGEDEYQCCINALGWYEDIEEELGIDLLILFKAVKQQKIWTKYDDELDCCDNCDYIFLEHFIYFYWDDGKHLVFELKDYGKTWALTKEELK